MKYARNLIALTFVAALVSACGGGSMSSQSVEPQLEEARKLNSELSATWTDFDSTMQATLTAVEEFPTIDVPVEKLDVELLKKALTECFDAPVEAANDAAKGGEVSSNEEVAAAGEEVAAATMAKCETESTSALNDLAQKGDDEISGFITKKLDSVAMLKTNLKDKLPTLATKIAEDYAAAKLKAEEIKLTADGVKTAADNNPLMDEAAKTKFNGQYEELQAELTSLNELLGTMEADALNLPDKVRVTLEKATYALSNFGQAPPAAE